MVMRTPIFQRHFFYHFSKQSLLLSTLSAIITQTANIYLNTHVYTHIAKFRNYHRTVIKKDQKLPLKAQHYKI